MVVEDYALKIVHWDAKQDAKDVRAPAKDFVETRVKKLAVKVVSLLVGQYVRTIVKEVVAVDVEDVQ